MGFNININLAYLITVIVVKLIYLRIDKILQVFPMLKWISFSEKTPKRKSGHIRQREKSEKANQKSTKQYTAHTIEQNESLKVIPMMD